MEMKKPCYFKRQQIKHEVLDKWSHCYVVLPTGPTRGNPDHAKD